MGANRSRRQARNASIRLESFGGKQALLLVFAAVFAFAAPGSTAVSAGQSVAKIKEDLAVTIRCIPFEPDAENGDCICCGRPDSQSVVFAKAY